MKARAESARTLAARTVGAYAEEWQATLRALRDPAPESPYQALDFTPHVGLAPLGSDPESRLFEFAHVQSGTVPGRDEATGRLVTNAESCIVLVLLPGGTFRMGDDSERAFPAEVPVHEVALDPFFLSKYEVTVAQWMRLFGSDPTRGESGDPTWPAYNVSWAMASRLLPQWGLELPTEAQWEYAARAGTETRRYTGDPASSLAGHANVWDLSMSKVSGFHKARPESIDPLLMHAPDLDDGYKSMSPVGCFLPNPFGLHDVYGNALEVVRDAFAPYTKAVRPGDGLRLGGPPSMGVMRGGSHGSDASSVRSAKRFPTPPAFRSRIGCRPSRALVGWSRP